MSGTHDSGGDALAEPAQVVESRPSTNVVIAVAATLGRSPMEMDPISEVVDPDALDSLLDRGRETAVDTAVTFEYCGCEVTVRPGEIRIDRA